VDSNFLFYLLCAAAGFANLLAALHIWGQPGRRRFERGLMVALCGILLLLIAFVIFKSNFPYLFPTDPPRGP